MYRKLSRHVLVCGLLLSSGCLYAQSPGGVGRQSLWLQGNFSSDPAQTRTLNFNPATNTDGINTAINLPGDSKDLRRATIFTVYQSPAPDQDRPVWQINGGFGDLLLSTRQLSSKSGKTNMVFGKTATASSKAKKGEAVISTYLRRHGSEPASENTGNKNTVIQFGKQGSSPQPDPVPSLTAELIVYETILKEKEIARVESYLAVKYGITLEKNYLNSLGEIIWNREQEKLYSNNIAGIGRDDHATLYQKQGTSCTTTDGLTIGIDNIAPSNGANTGRLNDRDYLLWGDNARPFTLSLNADRGIGDILLSDKKWLMKSSGKTAGAISTELQIDTRSFLPAWYPKENFYLVIDRTGSGDFARENCTYISPDNISAEGVARFSNVHWNKDGIGKSVFSFGLKTTLSAGNPANADAANLFNFHVYPNPVRDGHYTIAVALNKPTDITVQVYDAALHLIDTKKATGQAFYLLPGKISAAAGAYIVRVFTPGKEFSQIIIRQ